MEDLNTAGNVAGGTLVYSDLGEYSILLETVCPPVSQLMTKMQGSSTEPKQETSCLLHI